MILTSNATTGYFRWALLPGNDRIESSIMYLALVVRTVLIFSILMVTQQRQFRNNLRTHLQMRLIPLHNGDRITRDLNVCNKESNEK